MLTRRRASARPRRAWLDDSSSANGTDEVERADFGVVLVLADLAPVTDLDLAEATPGRDVREQSGRADVSVHVPPGLVCLLDSETTPGCPHHAERWRNRVATFGPVAGPEGYEGGDSIPVGRGERGWD